METSNGAFSTPVLLVNFIKNFSDGPATSFNGSPTVSPTTAAVCVGVPLIQKPVASILFFVLSHNAPPKVKNDARSAAVHVPPSSRPPKAVGPIVKDAKRNGTAAPIKIPNTKA